MRVGSGFLSVSSPHGSMNPDELAVTIQEVGDGPWELTLDDGETVTADLDEVEMTERGFHAEGRTENDRLVELTTGIQPGGAIRLKRRPSQGDDWTVAGEVVEATKLDHV